jgi:RteC protein
MKAFTENLHKELLSKLDELERNYNPQNLTDSRLHLITTAIDKIKEKLKTCQFKCTEDEIHYFKIVLPKTLALYIYYSDKIEWDRVTRMGSLKCNYKVGDRIFSQAENFRERHFQFNEYYRDGKTHLDYLYFLRKSPINRETKYQVRQIIDPSSPPLHCELLATLIAYNRLENELKEIIAEESESLSPMKSGKEKLGWTGKQIDLIELGYGLYEMGSFNNGNASRKDIFDYFEEVFDVDLGNTSSLFQDIVQRKTGSTTFLDSMRKKLLQRIDEFLN